MEEKLFIYIFDDGTVKKGPAPTSADLDACDDGLLDVIDPENLTRYYKGDWLPLEFA